MAGDDKSEESPGNEGNSIRVIIRVRPPATEGGSLDVEGTSAHCVDVDSSRNCIRMHSTKDPKIFTFDQVCDMKTTQETVFRSVGKKIIDSCVAGYNGTIFAYGQTGSGKTFTMLGPSENADNFQHELRGVIPRSFEYLFGLIKSQQDMHGDKIQFLCKCSFLEIYNESVYDLLDVAGARGLHLRENIHKGVFVDGLQETAVTSASHAYEVLTSGWTNRTVASTSMNRESSRSHAVFTVFVESKKLDNGVWNVRSSQLNLVDLAGSERQKDTNTTGARLKEAGNINKSLSALGNVITALVDICQGKNRHVPYRDSKLTFLLRDSLGGNAKTSVIACIHPGSRCFGETLSTLQFAKRAKMIKNKAVVNEDMQGSITHLQAEIRRLKEIIESGAASQPAASAAALPPGTDGSKFQQYFLHAMTLKQHLQQDKKLAMEKHSKLQDMLVAKERALRQNKMVIKFREDNIKKLEKALKTSDLANDDTVAIIENLESVVTSLQEQYNHHPDVLKYRMEADNVKAELRRVRAEQQQQVPNITAEVMAQLETEYKQMQLQAKTDGGTTPSSNTRTQGISTATLDRQKAQITKLQEELTQEKQTRADLQASTEKESLKLQSEVESLKATISELKKMNASTRTRYQVEREARDDMHADTIKKMTTPKKSKYNLRSRPEGERDGSFHDASLLECGEEGRDEDVEDIMAEAAPQVLIEGQVEALQEENKCLQEECRQLSEALSGKDDEVLGMIQEKTKLASQKTQLEQLLSKKQQSYEEESKILKESYDKLNETFTNLQREYEFTRSTAEDLQIMSSSADKKAAEAIQELKDKLASKEKEAGQIQSQAGALAVKVEQQEAEVGEWKVACERLQESEETLTATLDYTQSQLADADAAATQLKQDKAQLQADAESMSQKQEQMKERIKELKKQLTQQEGELQQQLVSLQSRVEERDVELEQERTTVQQLQTMCDSLRSTVKDNDAKIELLTKTEAELKDGIQRSLQEVMTAREAEEARGRQLEEAQARVAELHAEDEALKQQVAQAEDTNTRLRAENEQLENTLQEHIMKVEELTVDLDNYTEVNCMVEVEKQQLVEQQSQLEAQLAQVSQTAEEAQTQVSELQDREQTLLAENNLLEGKLREREAEFGTLRSQHDVLTASHAAVMSSEQQVQEKYAALKETMLTLKHAVSEDQAKLQQCVTVQKETEAREHAVEVSKLQEEVSRRDLALAELTEEQQKTREDLEKTSSWLARTQESHDKIQAVYMKLKEEQEDLQSKYQASEEEVKELSACKQQLQEADDQLTAHKALLTDKSQEIEALTLKSEEAKLLTDKAIENLKKTQQEREILKQQLENVEAEKAELETEKLRLQSVLAIKDSELSELQSSCVNAQEQLTAANKDVESLKEFKEKYMEVSAENARLVGHQNPKQKINYHLKIKEENNSLREKLIRMEKELALHKLNSTPSKLLAPRHATPLKEMNVPPPMMKDPGVKEAKEPLKENLSPLKDSRALQASPLKDLRPHTPLKENLPPPPPL